MSLDKAVQKVIERMKNDAEKTGGDVGVSLSHYASMLEVALEAAQGDYGVPAHVPSHREQIEKAKQEMRAQKNRTDAEEGLGGRVILARGGQSDGVYLPLEGGLPPDGAHTLIAGEVYTYSQKENLWVYDREETVKYHQGELAS